MRLPAVLKARAYLKVLTAKEKLFYVVLLYLASISTFSAVPFYPLLFVPFLALLPAFVAYTKRPEFGVILLGAMALPAFFYQSTAFAWLYLFFFSLMLFEVFDKWREIIMLFLLVSLPFTPFPLNLLAYFHYLFMLITVLHFSSKRSAFIVTSSLFLIFLLQALWQSFVPQYPLNLELYQTHPLLERKPFQLLSTFVGELSTAFRNVLDLRQLLAFGQVVDVVIYNLKVMLFRDTALLQILFWDVLLFIAPFITRLRVRMVETLSSLLLLLAIPFYYYIYSNLGMPYPVEHALFTLASVGIFYLLESNGFRFSREVEAIKKEEEKDLLPLGVRELTLAKGEKGLEDVGGYEDVKKELKESILTPLQKPELAYVYNLKPPRGILLFGPPGTGKTMIMRALAKELDYPFFYVKSTAVMSKWFGESERKIREIFERVRKKAPAILFFDEIDAIARDRSKAGEHTASLVTTLLQELDGFREDKPIIFVAATNRPDVLDKALLRPGRIDKIIYMRPPTFEERVEIFKKKLSPYPTEGVDYERLAKLTERYSGADIDRVVREAVLRVAERAKALGKVLPITQQDLEEVIRKSKPSITTSMLEMYERFRKEFERRMEEKKEEGAKLTFKDVVDMEKVKKALRRAIELPLKHPEMVEKYGLEPVKGILLFGPPGTGKTYVVKAAAGEFGANLVSLSAADLLAEGQGRAAERLKEAFNKARDMEPAILFIDEIDTIGSRATTPALFNQLLQEMDGLKSNKGVVVVGATNRPWVLDEALLRPGRFDAILYVGLPSKKVRQEILAFYLGDLAEKVDVEELARLTRGYSAADLKALANDIKALFLTAELEGREVAKDEVLELLKKRKPSVTREMLQRYKAFLEEHGERVLEG